MSMLKLVEWNLKDEYGYHASILNGPKATFEKTAASFEGEYSSDIIDAVDKLEKKAGHTYLLINAMGAGEFYGSNKNNDYFPEKVLKEYHKTFEALAYVFKHHVNKDPRRSYGKVIYSFYNDKMHRVELIVEVSNQKAQDILDRISNGENIAVSMGCKVPWDVCSECGNRAKTRRDYCTHMRRGSAGRINPNGRKPYAINLQPKFFDISFVTVPADPTAAVMSKVASTQQEYEGVTSVDNMEQLLKESGLKQADIVKRIDGKIESVATDPKNLIPFIQKDAPKDEIQALTDKYSLNEILSTLLAMNIMPKKKDFQRMVLYSSGKHDLANELDSCNCEFPVDENVAPIIPADVDPSLANRQMLQELAHWIPERSHTKPLVVIRVMRKMAELDELRSNSTSQLKQELSRHVKGTMIDKISSHLQTKKAAIDYTVSEGASPLEEAGKTVKPPYTHKVPEKNPMFAITGLGALYVGYQRLMNMGQSKNLPKMERTIIQNPWMLPLLAGAIGYSTVAAQKETNKMASYAAQSTKVFKPGTLKTLLAAAVPSYYYSGLQESKVRRGGQVDNFQDFVRKHPLLTTMGAFVGARSGIKALNKYASEEDIVQQMSKEQINKIYEELIS